MPDQITEIITVMTPIITATSDILVHPTQAVQELIIVRIPDPQDQHAHQEAPQITEDQVQIAEDQRQIAEDQHQINITDQQVVTVLVHIVFMRNMISFHMTMINIVNTAGNACIIFSL